MVAAAAESARETQRLGRYTLCYPMAKGGMATVYLAHLSGAHGFEQWVAVKVMHPHLAEDRRFVTMFLDEANVASKIRHPNVCAVLDFGEEDGTPYLVMEYMHGETLSTIARAGWESGELPLWVTARAVADASRGLHSAHELRGPDGKLRNLVHRDVSPSNILVLYDGISKIMDFGVAQAEDRLTDSTAGELKGKFAYMSPEQLQGRPLDRRSDVWSLGVVLWETTVGKRLFRAGSHGETAVAVLEREITDPREIRADYPDALAEVVMSALRRDPAKRTASAKEVADGLERYLLGTGELAGADQVAAWVDDHFADRRQKREELLTAPRPERQEGEPEVSSPSPSQSSLGAGFSHSGIAPTARPEKRSVWPLVVVALTAAVAGALALFLVQRGAEAPGGGEAAGEEVAAAAPSEAPPSTGAGGEGEPADPPTGEGEAAPEERRGAARAAAEDDAPVAPAEGEASPEDLPEPSPGETPEETPAASDATPAPEEPRRAPRRPRRRARASASAAPGTLNLLAIPAAEVRLGGRSLGRTPLIGVELPAGRHRLQLRPVDGSDARTVTVTIRPGERTRRSVSLATL